MEWSRIIASVSAVWRWAGWLLCLILTFAGNALREVPGVNAVIAAILGAIGEGLLAGAVGLFFLWAGYFVWSLTPAQRLRRFDKKIVVAMRQFYYANGPVREGMTGLESSTIIALAAKLKSKGIMHPPLEAAASVWVPFLTRLSGAAKAGDGAMAKRTWAEMESAHDS